MDNDKNIEKLKEAISKDILELKSEADLLEFALEITSFLTAREITKGYISKEECIKKISNFIDFEIKTSFLDKVA